jgi:hypothetical protein
MIIFHYYYPVYFSSSRFVHWDKTDKCNQVKENVLCHFYNHCSIVIESDLLE